MFCEKPERKYSTAFKKKYNRTRIKLKTSENFTFKKDKGFYRISMKCK